MKYRGFTLIELLAIIVILAIIALIAIPMISRIVDKTEDSASVRSAELYIDGVNQAIIRANLNGKFRPKECIIQEDGNLICDGTKELVIEATGSKPTEGILIIEDRKVVSFTGMILDKYELETDEKGKIIIKNIMEGSSYVDSAGVKADLSKELIPVVYSDSNWKVSSKREKWHDYENQEWANAVILKDGITKKVGDVINVDSEVQAMFVWIPRYEYKIDGAYGKHNDDVNVSSVSNDTSYPWLFNNGVYKSTSQGKANSTTSLKFIFTFNSANTLSFDWSVSSESPNYDYVYYTITKDGTPLSDTGEGTKIGGTTMGTSDSSMKYTNVSKELEPGTYELTFTYRKDGSNDTGTDAAYIKNISIGGLGENTPGEIEVNFISKKTTKASEGYRVHPAFTFGTEELSGIWVGKFETTGTANEPTILPSLASLRNQNIGTQFTTAQKFNSYFSKSDVDAHLMKNSEWGAVAYLSQSKYGKYGNSSYTGVNKEIMINNCSDFITGIAADTQNAPATAETCTTNTYETIKGQAASTTGNITGVYDMSGGAWEYVTGYLSIASSTWGASSTGNHSGFSEPLDQKYYDEYVTVKNTTACNNGICYGQALSETAGWYGDYSDFATVEYPWLTRGGNTVDVSNAGVYRTGHCGGYASDDISFRVVLVNE